MDRAGAYAIRMPDEATMHAILDARRPSMESKLTAYFADQTTINDLVRATLAGISGATAPTRADVAAYQAASMEFYRCTKKWAGGGICDLQMAAIIQKWHDRGLSDTVLTQIAYEVFAWTPPAP